MPYFKKQLQKIMTLHHSHKHIGDAEELKNQRLKKIRLQHTITTILFYVMCIAALCLTAFAIWAYMAG